MWVYVRGPNKHGPGKKCELCGVTYHAEKSHMSGKKHMRKLELQEQKGTQKPKINKNANSSSEKKQPESILKCYYCEVCDISYTGVNNKEHLSGKKHNRNKYQQKKNDIAKMEQKQQGAADKKCELCDVTSNSPAEEKAHIAGKKHMRKLELQKQKATQKPKINKNANSSSEQKQLESILKCYYCEVCDISYTGVNNKEHLSGKKHKRNKYQRKKNDIVKMEQKQQHILGKALLDTNTFYELHQNADLSDTWSTDRGIKQRACLLPMEGFPKSDDPQSVDASSLTEAQSDTDEIKRESLDFGAIRHYNENHLSPDDKVTRIKIVHYLETLIQKRIPNSYLLVYGSTLSGLDSKSSDIDIGLVCYDYDSYEEVYKSRTEIKQVLQNSRNLIRKHLGVLSCVSILHARVPILKLRILGIDCDIAYLNSYGDIDKAELLESYRKIDDRVAPFLFALRTWKNNRRIGDAGSGTFNTFSTNLLGLQYLQISVPPVLPCLQNNPDDLKDFSDEENYANFGEKNKKSIQELLEDFFYVYTNDFDYEYQIVSVRSGRFIPKGKFREDNRSVFGIEDPFEIDENVAKNVSENSVKLIIDEFERAAGIMLDTYVTFEKLVVPRQ